MPRCARARFGAPIAPAFSLTVGPRTETARLYEPAEPHQPGHPLIVFIESEVYFDRPGLYGDEQGDYPDNALRYSLYSRAALVSLAKICQSCACRMLGASGRIFGSDTSTARANSA